MKTNRVFLLLILLAFCLPMVSFGQANSLMENYNFLENTPFEKKVFFTLPAFKKNQPVIPQERVEEIQLLLNQFNNIKSLAWVGTADLATPVYSNLKKGILADKFYTANVNAVAAQERASAAVEQWGGELDWKLVKERTDRGLILTIKLIKPLPEIVDMYVFPEINVYPNQTFSLDGIAKVVWNNNVETTQGFDFTTTDSALVELGISNRYGTAKEQAGTAKVAVKYPGSSLTDTVKVNVLQFPPVAVVAKNEWQAYGLCASHSYAGVGALVKFPSGWMLNADFTYVNWNINYEKAWDIKIGRQLKFIPPKVGELYLATGIGRGEQLDNNWTATWGSLGMLYNFHLACDVYFMFGADVQYKFIHRQAKVGPLEFYQRESEPDKIYYTQEILRPEIKEHRADGRLWLGFGIKL